MLPLDTSKHFGNQLCADIITWCEKLLWILVCAKYSWNRDL